MNHLRLSFLLFCGLVFSLQVAAQKAYQLAAESSITIHGTSTLHDWKAVVPQYEGTFQISDVLLKKKIKTGPAVESAVLKFEVETIDGGRGPSMNKKIKAALQSTEHPQIIFELKEMARVTSVIDKNGEKFTLGAKGNLSMAGASQSVTLQLEGQRMENGQIQFKAKTPLKMSDFKIEPPSAMFGQIVTKDDISIEFNLVLSPK